MSETQTEAVKKAPIQVKLVVGSAAEAVTTIKERFGENARVLSVKQSESGGFARLLQKPRLEVIVEIPEKASDESTGKVSADTPAKPISKPAATPPTSKEPSEVKDEASSTNLDEEMSRLQESAANAIRRDAAAAEVKSAPKSRTGYFSEALGEEEPVRTEETKATAPLGSAANPVKRGTLDNVRKAVSMLQSVGFDESLIERIRYEIDFNAIGERSTVELYGAICRWLRNQFPDTKAKISGARRAFIGSSGVGKTSALCKALSADIFTHRLQPQVLKVDGDVPNPSYALETYCEIMGASFGRSWDEMGEQSLDRPLYVDLPGVRFHNPGSIESCKEILDEFGVEERIIVINAVYDADAIAEAMLCGERMGATAVVFTHLDEARKAGKLWRFLHNGRIRPLFFSHGPNQAGDYTMDPFSALLEKTFPNGRELVGSAAKQTKAETREEAVTA